MNIPTSAVLMVCMGNICRSPTAEGVLRHKLELAGLARAVVVDSAGTHAWHQGEPPDPRSVQHARQRGYDLSTIRSRPIRPDDFERFDLILAMDWDNLTLLEEACPPRRLSRLRRLAEFGPSPGSPVIPDPYQGGPDGFEHVLDLIEASCDGLVRHLSTTIFGRTCGTS